jgi:3-mercaptopyruvate sulfurtransferase SseA
MRLLGLPAGVLTAALLIVGCGQSKQPANVTSTGSRPQANAANTQPDNVRRMTITELRDALDQGTAVVVDVRGEDAYKQEHIKGALDIPETQLMSRLGELPKDKLIVFYCS